MLPELAKLGFDVVYLPPIHPIGVTNRKGRNNTLTPAPGDVGSPWAIGGKDGGHTAVNADLGTLEEFEQLVARAGEHGLEIALDFAIQCSPDHPWLREHPEWFHRRPDGTLKYAENPPKKYQDIYNVNFDCRGLARALAGAARRGAASGSRAASSVFRVDNPHTKPVAVLGVADRGGAHGRAGRRLPVGGVHAAGDDDDAREDRLLPVLHVLHVEEHDVGAEGVRDAAAVEWREFYRPNFFANTPDILHEYLQDGGRPAFEARLVLAATLVACTGSTRASRTWRTCRCARAARSTSTRRSTRSKKRALDGAAAAARAAAERDPPREPRAAALREPRPSLETENEQLFAYAKRRGGNAIVVVVNLDPFADARGCRACCPSTLGLPPAFQRASC